MLPIIRKSHVRVLRSVLACANKTSAELVDACRSPYASLDTDLKLLSQSGLYAKENRGSYLGSPVRLLYSSCVAEQKKSSFTKLAHEGGENGQWALLRRKGYEINPCNSKLHPSVTVEGLEPDSEEEVCVQEAYTPDSMCFGCGPAANDGLKLKSFRSKDGMEAVVTIDPKYCAFPGIVNGGIVAALFDCHGNWTAAVSLMDKGCLPKPPLTVVYEMLITHEEPTPPNEELILRSKVVDIQENGGVGSKATVHVDLALLQKFQTDEDSERVIATGSGIFKKLGALRAL
jgi:hypothetical protein